MAMYGGGGGDLCPCLLSHLAPHPHSVNQNQFLEQRLSCLFGAYSSLWSPSALSLHLASHHSQVRPSQGTVKLQSQGPLDGPMIRCLNAEGGFWVLWGSKGSQEPTLNSRLLLKKHSHRPSEQGVPQTKGKLDEAGLLKLLGLGGSLTWTQVKWKG